ncbi:MAG: co-chaperone GroES [Candidatus Dojkabacteria bacterium]|jgi:chaperonin GroES|nr:co-chaperone GroES [Candidatus Dojkabacteria bacterium]MDD2270409.1 co-chaperone GroES [Candidatus Dojkabacteria bacterium]
MAEINIQPLGNRVLVKPQEEEETIAGGLVVPPSANEDKRPAMGEVLKIGKGKDENGKAVEFQFKKGDVIYFKKYSPNEIEIGGEEYLIVDAEDILAVINS